MIEDSTRKGGPNKNDIDILIAIQSYKSQRLNYESQRLSSESQKLSYDLQKKIKLVYININYFNCGFSLY